MIYSFSNFDKKKKLPEFKKSPKYFQIKLSERSIKDAYRKDFSYKKKKKFKNRNSRTKYFIFKKHNQK